MFVTNLECGPSEAFLPLPNPTWEEARSAIESLNGTDKDTVVLDGRDNQYMGISGGNQGRYVVGGYHKDFGSFLAACGTPGEGALDVSVSGDYNSFDRSHILDLPKAIELAEAFFVSGTLKEDGKWIPR